MHCHLFQQCSGLSALQQECTAPHLSEPSQSRLSKNPKTHYALNADSADTTQGRDSDVGSTDDCSFPTA